MDNPNQLLADLVAALDGAFICNLQSTADWKDPLDAARAYVEKQKQHDALIDALDLAAKTISDLETSGDLDTETLPVIMAAIDSAKGGAK